MEADREQRIDDLFHVALARPLAERAAFLAEACDGDEELRREVSSLLAAHEGADGFMEKPVVEAATRLPAVWRQLLAACSLNVGVVEDSEHPPEGRIVAFGASVFVTDQFIREAQSDPVP